MDERRFADFGILLAVAALLLGVVGVFGGVLDSIGFLFAVVAVGVSALALRANRSRAVLAIVIAVLAVVVPVVLGIIVLLAIIDGASQG